MTRDKKVVVVAGLVCGWLVTQASAAALDALEKAFKPLPTDMEAETLCGDEPGNPAAVRAERYAIDQRIIAWIGETKAMDAGYGYRLTATKQDGTELSCGISDSIGGRIWRCNDDYLKQMLQSMNMKISDLGLGQVHDVQLLVDCLALSPELLKPRLSWSDPRLYDRSFEGKTVTVSGPIAQRGQEGTNVWLAFEEGTPRLIILVEQTDLEQLRQLSYGTFQGRLEHQGNRLVLQVHKPRETKGSQGKPGGGPQRNAS